MTGMWPTAKGLGWIWSTFWNSKQKLTHQFCVRNFGRSAGGCHTITDNTFPATMLSTHSWGGSPHLGTSQREQPWPSVTGDGTCSVSTLNPKFSPPVQTTEPLLCRSLRPPDFALWLRWGHVQNQLWCPLWAHPPRATQ